MAGVMRERLIDWSKYNGLTDLAKAVEAWGIIGLMARCTIGWGYFDSYYEHNFRQAQKLGLLFGAYHVLWPWNKDPLKEVEHFKNHLMVDGTLPDFVVDDIELPKPSDTAGWKKVSAKQVAQQAVVQAPAIRARTGLPTFIYTGSYWWNDPTKMGLHTPLGIESDFMLIEAEYCEQEPCGKLGWDEAPQAPRRPSIGKGWEQKDLLMWQWTNCLKPIGNGEDGIKATDGDVLIPTYEQFLVLLGKTAPPHSEAVQLERLWAAHPELHHA